ncbi:exonuclease domain-containing protein [Mumia sp. ZJ430]|uniref:exonuclease domain-containing protein n=1 Tax=Mumia sp. ZJ430 TaxID=2708083 RepID=UPI001AB01E3E|nr:exonuclease domain-containing protein [Mumia sp. ZJ430]
MITRMYAVIDTETTGLSPKYHHRIAEIGVVLVDGGGRIEHEWSTLVNPDRDLGPQRIHGIRAADARRAPRFEDLAAHLIELLRGRTLVAHNLPFDLTFLDAEYARLGAGFPVDRSHGLCTMNLAASYLPGAGRSLAECCAAAGIPLGGWHSASADARATADLLSHFLQRTQPPYPWSSIAERAITVPWPQLAPQAFSTASRATRSMSIPGGGGGGGLVAGIVDYLPRVSGSAVADPYLAVLDAALADRYLSADEIAALGALAGSLGLTAADTDRLHRDYVNALARVALADHVLTDDERADLATIVTLLELPAGTDAEALVRATGGATTSELSLTLDDLVVFTGEFDEPRSVWMERATAVGLRVHHAVTKKVTLVIAADVDSLSGKAKKARGYGIRVVSLEEFEKAPAMGVVERAGV